MENTDILEIWKSQNARIEENLKINKWLMEESLRNQSRTALSGLKSIRWFGIIFGIVWCIFIGFILTVSWSVTNLFFKASFIIHLAVSMAAIALYIYHLILLDDVDNGQSVVQTQQKLIRLRNSNLLTLRLLWLQLPVFSTWFMSNQWMHDSPATFWGIHTPIVLIQAYIGFWIYKNLDYKNYDKKWFRWFVSKGEFGKINKANQLLNDIIELTNKN